MHCKTVTITLCTFLAQKALFLQKHYHSQSACIGKPICTLETSCKDHLVEGEMRNSGMHSNFVATAVSDFFYRYKPEGRKNITSILIDRF